MFRSLYISRSLQTMGQLINAGVPMLDTLRSRAISRATRCSRACGSGCTRGEAGQEDHRALQKDDVLPKSVVQMISAGEESGKLGEVLDEISAYYARSS
jgi:type IV pilus assembly protein PilC